MSVPVRRSAGQADRWNPIRDFEDLYLQMDGLAQSALGGSPGGRSWLTGDTRPWLPAGDVTETDDAYVVEIEVPGVKRDDIDIELYGSELVITGELKERQRKGLLRRRTRKVGGFEYRVTLPGDIRPDDVEASLDSGVLSVRVPKMDAAKPNKIKIAGS